MRLRTLVALCVVFTCFLPAAALAQSREPHALSIAIGGDTGILVGNDNVHVGFTPQASGEIYFLPRLSLRILEGWSRNGVKGDSDLDLEQFRTALSLVWNWEAELWHPFVLAGGSVHSVRMRHSDGQHSSWDTQPGFHVGVGAEFFAKPKVSMKFEGTFYWADRDEFEQEASGFVLTAGLKKYF
jgi:hypothetical protein